MKNNNKTGLSLKSKSKSIKRIIIILIILIIAGVGGFFTWKHFFGEKTPENLTSQNVNPTVDETDITDKQKDEHQVPAEYPRYISVPSLGVDRARVVQIGIIQGTKQLDSPISIHDAGWYNESAKPGVGNSGALLLDGHNGGPTKGGIFENLGDLEEGSEIIIERGDGKKFTYKVIKNTQMTVAEANDKNNPDGMSAMTKSADASKQGLNIITCVGNWVPEQKTYDKRVMLRAVLAD